MPITVKIIASPTCMPKRASDGAAGWDLYARKVVTLGSHTRDPRSSRTRVPTGVRIQLPPGYEAQIRPRSGLSSQGFDAAFGTVDSDYRGEISVVLTNNSDDIYTIDKGQRIAQMVIVPVPEVTFEPVDALDDTARGDGGFGSTGR